MQSLSKCYQPVFPLPQNIAQWYNRKHEQLPLSLFSFSVSFSGSRLILSAWKPLAGISVDSSCSPSHSHVRTTEKIYMFQGSSVGPSPFKGRRRRGNSWMLPYTAITNWWDWLGNAKTSLPWGKLDTSQTFGYHHKPKPFSVPRLVEAQPCPIDTSTGTV